MGTLPVAASRALRPLAAAALCLTGCQAALPSPLAGGGWAFVLPEAAEQPAAPAVPVEGAGRPPAGLPDTPTATPPSAPAPAAGGTAGGAGGGAAAPPAAVTAGTVLDEVGLPVAGATVMFADGRRLLTDDAGRFDVPGAAATGTVMASKPGYATSVVMGLAELATLHLRRSDGGGEPFVRRKKVVTGIVRWPSADHLGGAVHYVDDLGSTAVPVLIAANGQFSLEVEPVRAGEPRGVVMVFAATNTPGETLMGVSRPFDTFGQDGPGEVPVHLASRAIAYDVDGVPAGHPLVTTRLEVRQDDGPTATIEGTDTLSGTMMAPPDGLLPGVTRLVVAARSADGQSGTRIAFAPSGVTARGTLLALPGFSLAGRVASWTAVPGAAGYRLSTQLRTAAVPAWEAWLPGQTSYTLPTAAIPADGPGDVLLEAVEAAGLTSRHVASARQLRVEPWADADAHRVSYRRLQL